MHFKSQVRKQMMTMLPSIYDHMNVGIWILSRKMASFRQFKNIIVL